MQIPDQLTFSVREAADLLGMGRQQLYRMINAGTIAANESFTTSGRRPTVRITRGCIERLAGLTPSTAGTTS